MGNHQEEKKFFILSATADIRAIVKDNVSLTLLAIRIGLMKRQWMQKAIRLLTGMVLQITAR
jgi:hypothetical protein